MNIDFSLVLVVLSAVGAAVWLYDRVVLRQPRQAATQEILQRHSLAWDGFRNYVDLLDEDGQLRATEKDKAALPDAATQAVYRKALERYREPVAVEYAKSFFPILFAVLLLRSFVFEPFQIPTGSMIPTINVGDFIVVNKYAYGLRLPVVGTKILPVGEPKRGDVMVFIPPHEPIYYIKRVIGLPGDHIQYRDKVVYVNGEALAQQDLGVIPALGVRHLKETVNGLEHDIYTAATPERFERFYDWMPPEGIVVPQGHYFMMGDNRDNSSDSRYWGPVPEKNIVGKAIAVWMHKEPGFNLPSFSENRFISHPR